MRPSCFAALVATALLSPAPASATPAVARLIASPAYKAAVAVLDREHDRIVADIVSLTEISAPPFKEKARATAYMAMLRAAGLSDVEMDAEGNVMGLRRGTGPAGRPLVVIAAHLDTVAKVRAFASSRAASVQHFAFFGCQEPQLAFVQS